MSINMEWYKTVKYEDAVNAMNQYKQSWPILFEKQLLPALLQFWHTGDKSENVVVRQIFKEVGAWNPLRAIKLFNEFSSAEDQVDVPVLRGA